MKYVSFFSRSPPEGVRELARGFKIFVKTEVDVLQVCVNWLFP